MKMFSRRILILSALVFSSLWQPVAQADVIDDFAWILNQLDQTGANPFPVSGSDIQDSRGLFTCLENAPNDVAVANCIDTFKDTSIGKQANSQAGIPSWFWDLLDAYIALREKDYWGLVAKLGEASVCIVAHILTSGAADVCGIIEELVALAKDVLDTGKAIAKFIASIGEGAWEAIQSVGCSLGLGGCGESSPPEQIAYAWVFAPRISNGLVGRKSVDANAFNTVLTGLKNNARHNPVIWSIPSIQSALPHYPPFSQGVTETAAKIYTDVVDAQWSADMGKNVLPALATKQGQYNNPSQIAVAAYDAANYHKQNKTASLSYRVTSRCKETFEKNFGFAHVDRWRLMYPAQAQSLGNVKSLSEWCSQTFWQKNRDKFAPHFQQFASTQYCPQQGAVLVCASLDRLDDCISLMSSVDKQSVCTASVTAAKAAAAKIDAYFKSKGSQIPCQTIVKNNAKPPVEYQCTRPAQQYHCEAAYKNYFGQLANVLLTCTLVQDASYGALVVKAKQAAFQINNQYGLMLQSNPIDPLTFLNGPSPSQVSDDVKQDIEKNRGFGPPSTRPGFLIKLLLGNGKTPSIDGESSPTIIYAANTNFKQLTKPVERALVIDPRQPGPDPYKDRLQNQRLNTLPSQNQVKPVAPSSRQTAPVQNLKQAPSSTQQQQLQQEQLQPAIRLQAPAR